MGEYHECSVTGPRSDLPPRKLFSSSPGTPCSSVDYQRMTPSSVDRVGGVVSLRYCQSEPSSEGRSICLLSTPDLINSMRSRPQVENHL
jgi:hypothetical protein